MSARWGDGSPARENGLGLVQGVIVAVALEVAAVIVAALLALAVLWVIA